MEKPVIILPPAMRFADLCLILDFAYTGQAQVPHERLDDFLKMGELLQIRGIKEGRIHYMSNLSVQTIHQTTTTTTFNNKISLDSTISSTQESIIEPVAKRPREDEDILAHEASEFMLKLLEGGTDIDVDVSQVKPLATKKSDLIRSSGPVVPQNHKVLVSKSAIAKPAFPVKQKPSFLCHFCSRTMCTQARINKHESECDDNPKRVTTICDICGCKLKPSAVVNHKRLKHGISKASTSTSNKTIIPSQLSNHTFIAEKIQKLPIINRSPLTSDSQSPKIKNSSPAIIINTDTKPFSPDESQTKAILSALTDGNPQTTEIMEHLVEDIEILEEKDTLKVSAE